MTLERGITIIVCCYNSSTRIEPTLKHLALQNIGEQIPCEIIVVNNASTDDLEAVVEDTWSKCGSPYPLKVVFEPTPGLAFARRCGVQQAKYSYGVFCDDDNWLAPNYLARIAEIFDAKSEVGVIGGCSTPVLESEAPAWFYTKCYAYAVGVQAPQTGDITHRGYIWGAGMGFRLNILKSIYGAGIDPLVSDRTKDTLTSGGDAEISSWFIFAGYRLWYDSEIEFQHFIPETRLTTSYYEKFFNMKYVNLWPLYQNYAILKFGIFNNPRRTKMWSLFPLILRFVAAFKLATNFSLALSVDAIYKSINKIVC